MNLEDKKLLFIGAGNMAEALIQGLLNSKKIVKENIFFTEVLATRREYIQKKFGVRAFLSNKEAVLEADVVLFAVKPQNIREILDELKGIDLHLKVFITIAAGIRIHRFEEKLGTGVRVIRAMPNMAALIGYGISGVSRGRFAGPEDEDLACEIIGTVGEIVRLPENQLDAVTALSGSGPAYFFLFMEALEAAGARLGLDPILSAKLVEHTALGAALLVQKTKETPMALRRKVTSPGGTTEAAVRFFEDANFQELVIQALEKAEMRAKELSKAS